MTRNRAATVWLTGLPGAGKTTLAGLLEVEFRLRGLLVECLDGDAVRILHSNDLGYSRRDRNIHVRQIGLTCSLLSRNGVYPIAAMVSPFRQVREQVRMLHEPGRFIEVFVCCPLADLVARDQKNQYARAMRGEIASFTGVSDPYEPPLNPEIVVHTNSETIEQSFDLIKSWLQDNGYLTYEVERSIQSVTASDREISYSPIST
jgi:adenylylsulfate kinase